MEPIEHILKKSILSDNPAHLKGVEERFMHRLLFEIQRGAGGIELCRGLRELMSQYRVDVDEATLVTYFENEARQAKPAQYDPKGLLKSGKIHPALVTRLEKFLKAAWQDGARVIVQEGYRDHKKQDELFKKGGVTNARGGDSYHNYGLAVDVVFLDEKNRLSWSPRHDWKRLGELGKKFGLKWGGDFSKLKDLCHFEYHPKLTIKDLKALYREGQLPKVWQAVV